MPSSTLLAGFLAPVLIALTGCTSAGVQSAAPKAAPGAPVTIAIAEMKSAPLDINVIGNVEAYSTIAVKSLVGGELTEAHFNEGDYVAKSAILFTMDQRPFQAALRQAEANLARDTALLTQAEANLARDRAQAEYARSQSGRYEKLMQEGVISRQQADQFVTDSRARDEAVKADLAAIESARAAMQADQAAIETAKLQLAYTVIRSPLEGRTGNLMVKQGNIVKANDINLVNINQVQPIYVTFAIPENRLSDVKGFLARGSLPVTATQQGETTSETGNLTFIDNAVDSTTGTIKLKGTFPNPQRRLWPGEFVRVALRLSAERAVLVPSEAVQSGQQGQYVFVVKPDMSAELRVVTVGRAVGDESVIASGLQAGERVVREGQLRLTSGTRVQIRETREQ